MPPPDLVPLREAATLIGVSGQTLTRWIHAGRMAGWRRGSRWLVSKGDALATLKPYEKDIPAPSKRELAAQEKWVGETLRRAGIRK